MISADCLFNERPQLSSSELLGCPECGLLQRRVALRRGQVANCGRCGGDLYAAPSGNLDRPLALATAALILFVLANCFPVLGLDVKGRHTEATLLEAALQLRTSGMSLIAGLVLFTTVAIPAMELSGVLYVLAPLKLGVRLPGQLAVYKLIHRLEPWGMIEVYLLGVMVALVKLAHMAAITPGWALWLLGGFVLMSAATSASLHPDEIWSWLAESPPATAGAEPLCRCHDCGWLAPERDHGACPRCGSELHARKLNSTTRSWALLIAAALLYIPANLLPVMVTTSLGGTQSDTILSGVVYLWVSGSWPLALVVFFASIMVPMLKLVSLILLLVSVQRRWQWRPIDRTRLYRVTELVGRWSMVDIFVVTMLVALVHLRPLASVDAGPGAVAFGAVVVLTMLAAEAFDPRLIWDALQPGAAALPPNGSRAPPRRVHLPMQPLSLAGMWQRLTESDGAHELEWSSPPPVSVSPAGRFSVVWVIPLVAALIGGWLVWKSVSERGPTITIVFKNAEGLEPGKTAIKYRDVEVGKLTDLELSPDRQSVVATAELRSGTDAWLFEDTRFWVVRPRVVAGNISGLSTLLSGVYIGIDVGQTGAHIHEFRGLDVAPLLTSDRVGKRFVLKSEELGSLDVGAPIYFRHIKVGQILAYEMDADGRGVTLQAFVEAPYDRYVTRDSRFWQASGLDVSLDASGIKLDSESLLTLVIGGLAFGPRYGSTDTEPAPADSVYTLFDKRTKALAPPKVESRTFTLFFNESLRGLTAGAPVDFRGLQLGEVSGVRGEYDPERRTLKAVVDIALIWDIVVRKTHGDEMHLNGEPLREQIQHMVDKGFRAQLRSGNLLTGQMYVALDFFPDVKPAAIDWASETPEFPTMPGALASLTENVNNLFKKIDKLPLDETTAEVRQAVRSLDQALRSTDRLMTGLDRDVMPEARATLIQVKRTLDEAQKSLAADGPLQHDARDALGEVTRAAQSLRVLMDYLDRHPESLLLGKGETTVMRRPALVGLMLILTGCGSTPDRFYTLMPDSRAAPRPAVTTKVERMVVVGPVTVPAMLNQAQMVINQGGQQMDVREAERWAAPLKDEFTAALAARLEVLLPQMAVAAHHQSAGLAAELRIEVDVSRFELGPGRQTALDALWVIKSDDPAAERRGRTRLAVVAAGDDYQQLAQAQGRALDQLALALAEAVKAPEEALHGSVAPESTWSVIETCPR